MGVFVKVFFRNCDRFSLVRRCKFCLFGNGDVLFRIGRFRREDVLISFRFSFPHDSESRVTTVVRIRYEGYISKVICRGLYFEFYFQVASSSSNVILGCSRSIFPMRVRYRSLVVERWCFGHYQVSFLYAGSLRILLYRFSGSFKPIRYLHEQAKGRRERDRNRRRYFSLPAVAGYIFRSFCCGVSAGCCSVLSVS